MIQLFFQVRRFEQTVVDIFTGGEGKGWVFLFGKRGDVFPSGQERIDDVHIS